MRPILLLQLRYLERLCAHSNLVAWRGLKGKNKCYRRLKAWGLHIPDRRL